MIPDVAAVERLRGFMAEQGHPSGELAWLFREDVSTRRRRILVKVPLPPGIERLAREGYEMGHRLGLNAW